MTDLASLLNKDILSLAGEYPVVELKWRELNDCGLSFSIKRDDLLHPLVSGNKLYKLWGHLRRAKAQGAQQLLSFGGAYSNHLHALAAAGQALGIATLGIIRGERAQTLTPTLRDCEALGMTLYFVSRQEYRDKHLGASAQRLMQSHANVYLVPEGGGGEAGSEYCGALMSVIEGSVSASSKVPAGNDEATLCVPCGTATTFRGLLRGSCGQLNMMGFSAIKAGPLDNEGGEPQLTRDTRSFIDDCQLTSVPQWRIDYGSARRGFARPDPELMLFIQAFFRETGVPLEPVYTGKMLLRILELAREEFWPEGHTIIALHTGGLQGLRGYPDLESLIPQSIDALDLMTTAGV